VEARRQRIGELLVAAGVLTRGQLDEALADRERHGRPERLGGTVVRLGLASESDVADAVAQQLRLERVDFGGLRPTPDALARVPGYLAERHDLLPLRVADDTLVVATSDPSDTAALDDLRLVAEVRAVHPVVATPSSLLEARRRLYAVDATTSLLEHGTGPVGRRRAADESYGVPDLVTGQGTDPVVKLVDTLLMDALASRASDLHLEPAADGRRVRLRIDGLLRERGHIPPDRSDQVVSRLKVVAGLDITERRLPQDGRVQAIVDGQLVDLRLATMPTLRGESLLVRLLPTGSAGLPLARVGLAEQARSRLVAALQRPQGLVVVTGPTGSGKTTTLYAGLREVLDERRKVLTLEDPVEYVLPGLQQTQIAPELGLTFERGLRHLLRHDPDVVLVGEIRDRETAQLAVEASFTGHLVLTTMHTNDAPAAITRLINLGVDRYVVAAALTLVIAQRLARTVCETCAETVDEPEQAVLRRLGLAPGDLAGATLRRGAGCGLCDDTGELGRTAVSEAMAVTPRLRELIGEGAPEASIHRLATDQGMGSLREDALGRARAGNLTLEEVWRVTPESSADAVRCPDCDAVVGDDLHVCPWCAAVLRGEHCSDCSRALEPGWRVCPWCGGQPASPRVAPAPPT
jgi:type IV pilus assembly protein PilB